MKRDERDPPDPGDVGEVDREGDDELEALVAGALVERGELLPTTEAEVLHAERAGVAFEGELPPELAEYSPPTSERAAPLSRRAPQDRAEPVRSTRVVSLEEARRRPQRGAWLGYGATFVAGAAAAAAAIALFVRAPPGGPTDPSADPEQTAGVGTGAPPAPSSIATVSVDGCPEACCAGASCAAAEGELRACGSGRTCIPCGDPPASRYRVRIGHLFPDEALDTDRIDALDLCARVGSSRWDCAPAYADPATSPEWRRLPALATSEDAGAGVELELRVRGTKQALGRWHGGVRIGPPVLCSGVGVSLEDTAGKSLGRLSLFFDDAHYVELRRGTLDALEAYRGELAIAGAVPRLFETSRGGPERFALVVGPLDEPRAERLRWSLLEQGVDARVELGGDYVGDPRDIP